MSAQLRQSARTHCGSDEVRSLSSSSSSPTATRPPSQSSLRELTMVPSVPQGTKSRLRLLPRPTGGSTSTSPSPTDDLGLEPDPPPAPTRLRHFQHVLRPLLLVSLRHAHLGGRREAWASARTLEPTVASSLAAPGGVDAPVDDLACRLASTWRRQHDVVVGGCLVARRLSSVGCDLSEPLSPLLRLESWRTATPRSSSR